MIWFMVAPFVILAAAAFVADTVAPYDDDLVWLDRQIERLSHIEPPSPEAAEQQRDTLERLRLERVRVLKLQGGIE